MFVLFFHGLQISFKLKYTNVNCFFLIIIKLLSFLLYLYLIDTLKEKFTQDEL